MVLVALCVLAASSSKISVGAVMACCVGPMVLLSARGPLWQRLIAGALTGPAPFLVVYLSVPIASGSDAALIAPFAYHQQYGSQADYHIIWTLIVSWAALRHRAQLMEHAWLSCGLLAGVWAALVASLLLNLEAGAQYYFGNPGIWLGLILLGLLRWPDVERRTWLRRSRVWLVGVIAVLGIANEDTLRVAPESFAKMRAELRTAPLNAQPFAPVWQAAQSAQAAGVVALFVPPTQPVWQTRDPFCWQVSLGIAALSSVPLIHGLPPGTCEVVQTYGFLAYDLKSARSSNQTDDTLCRTAARLISPGDVWRVGDSTPLACPVTP